MDINIIKAATVQYALFASRKENRKKVFFRCLERLPGVHSKMQALKHLLNSPSEAKLKF
jgi:hypothetical protein